MTDLEMLELSQKAHNQVQQLATQLSGKARIALLLAATLIEDYAMCVVDEEEDLTEEVLHLLRCIERGQKKQQ